MSSDETDLGQDYFEPEILSASWLSTWLKCPRQFGYAKVSGIRIPPGWAMVGGTAMDHTLNEHLTQKIQGVNGLRGTALTDYYVTTLRRLGEKLQPTGEKDPDLEAGGAKLLPLYERQVSDKIEPLEVQKEVRIPFPDLGPNRVFVAHLDLIRSNGPTKVISDHKFVGKSPMPDKAVKSLQLRAYDYVIDDPSHQVEMINLVRLKRDPKIVVQPYIVTPDDRAEFLRMLRWVSRMSATKLYPQCDPTSWVCNPNWCGFYSLCRGRKGGPLPISGEIL